jgi:hypothetical protein
METQKYQPKREGQTRPLGGEAFESVGRVRQVTAASEKSNPITAMLVEEVVRRENLTAALKRVRANNSGVFTSWNDGSWGGAGEMGRDAARRSFITSAQ